jgi:hypothetical protein
MSIDEFSVRLLEEAKHFIEKYDDSKAEPQSAYLHASLVLALCSLEAHVNAICEDFVVREDLSPWDKSVLLEKAVDMKHGDFVLTERMKMQRLDERILYLCNRFSRSPIDRTTMMWTQLKEAIELRNKLVHPKEDPALSRAQVVRAVEAVILTLDHLFTTLYKQGFPQAKRGMQSTLSF